MTASLILLAAAFLAYWNGANDNFKGVATLYGSGTLSYRAAISVATVATFLGSVSAIFLAQGLIASFSGKGLVPSDITVSPNFLMAVGLGAAFTVLLATKLGFPISTTHSLVGALTGAGLMAVGSDVNFTQLGTVFFIPLLLSPFIAVLLGGLVYWSSHQLRKRSQLTKESCICIGETRRYIPVASLSQQQSLAAATTPAITVAEEAECVDLYTDQVWGIRVQKLLDIAHGLSGATVCYARGLNDTPKIAGLLVAMQALNISWGMVGLALAMALGGLLHARKVADKMSLQITELNHGQGFSANIVTAILVLFASKLGVPVSTTHVSVGAIFGIGAATGKADKRTVGSILLSWLITLPVAVIFSALSYLLFANLI